MDNFLESMGFNCQMDKIVKLLLLILVASPVAATADGFISSPLEASLVVAATNGGYYQLKFDGAGTVPLTKPLVISKDLVLEGVIVNAALGSQVSLSASNLSRLFVVQNGVKLTLNNLTLLDGHHTSTNTETGGVAMAAGGLLFNDGGTVVISNSVIANHDVIGQPGLAGTNDFDPTPGGPGEDAQGGAIYSRNGSVLLSECVLNANGVQPGQGGRGADAVLVDSGGDGGNAGRGLGGAVYIESGTLSVFNTLISSNQVLGASGGTNGVGAGLVGFDGTPGNAAMLGGAGLYLGAGATGIVSGVTLVGNTITNVSGMGGPAADFASKGQDGRQGGPALGGGLFNVGVLRMTNCTTTANILDAGNGGAGGVGSKNGFGTDGGNGGTGGTAQGAGLYNVGSAFVQNCTFSGNNDLPGTGGAAGVGASPFGKNGKAGATGDGRGANLFHTGGGTVRVANSLLDNPIGGLSVAGDIDDLGGNLCSDSSLVIKGLKSQNGVIINLLSLTNRGGFTPTMALNLGNPAVGIANPAYTLATDQRGVPRPTPASSGAFELEPFRLLISLAGTNAVVQWPLDFSGFNLQKANGVPAVTNDWTVVTPAPTITNRVNQVLIALEPKLSNSILSRFFRLTPKIP